jgi:hypothetical protein
MKVLGVKRNVGGRYITALNTGRAFLQQGQNVIFVRYYDSPGNHDVRQLTTLPDDSADDKSLRLDDNSIFAIVAPKRLWAIHS